MQENKSCYLQGHLEACIQQEASFGSLLAFCCKISSFTGTGLIFSHHDYVLEVTVELPSETHVGPRQPT